MKQENNNLFETKEINNKFYPLFTFWKDQPKALDSDVETLEKLIESTFGAEALLVHKESGILDQWETYNNVARNVIVYVYELMIKAAYKILFLKGGYDLNDLPERDVVLFDMLFKANSNVNIFLKLFDVEAEKTASSNIGRFYQIIESQVLDSKLLTHVFKLLFNILKKELKKPNLESRESLLSKLNYKELSRDTFIKVVECLKSDDFIERTRLEIEVNFFSIDKTLFILRGVPGSGKDSLITNLVQNSLTTHGKDKVRICCTDDYFINPKTGEYEFDITKLVEYHERCFYSCQEAMVETENKNAVPFIFLNNTNIKEEHIKPYRELAERYEYTVMELFPSDMFDLLNENDPEKIEAFLKQFTERNQHGVSYDKIKEMYLNLKKDYQN